ncbi:MAG TPA: hypothetical protein DD861_01145 [Erythrobacter sp.]|nr:hypothetical protein [Erythrobacter sp.]
MVPLVSQKKRTCKPEVISAFVDGGLRPQDIVGIGRITISYIDGRCIKGVGSQPRFTYQMVRNAE